MEPPSILDFHTSGCRQNENLGDIPGQLAWLLCVALHKAITEEQRFDVPSFSSKQMFAEKWIMKIQNDPGWNRLLLVGIETLWESMGFEALAPTTPPRTARGSPSRLIYFPCE